ncbi:hypothetical protein BD289DRAFT_240718 [Coniella lustricola]|uniref:Uncharacterized protein n=1 Tax=Coniella lustricola TaxID=2025994 RepID=A0A2T3ALD7_9PEZI|nr:hypothetical protein BD289DRAFT_240718 [Coniella lustricola]
MTGQGASCGSLFISVLPCAGRLLVGVHEEVFSNCAVLCCFAFSLDTYRTSQGLLTETWSSIMVMMTDSHVTRAAKYRFFYLFIPLISVCPHVHNVERRLPFVSSQSLRSLLLLLFLAACYVDTVYIYFGFCATL